jgi:hypothetical protein
MWNLVGLGSQVKTLLDRLTSTRAGYLDRLDATISSRASASNWTAALASKIDTNLDDTISSRAAIPLVQTDYVNSGGLSTGSGEDGKYIDVTITTEVSAISACLVRFDGCANTVAFYDLDASGVTARLTSTTNLRLSTLRTDKTRVVGRWTVVDYGGGA